MHKAYITHVTSCRKMGVVGSQALLETQLAGVYKHIQLISQIKLLNSVTCVLSATRERVGKYTLDTANL